MTPNASPMPLWRAYEGELERRAHLRRSQGAKKFAAVMWKIMVRKGALDRTRVHTLSPQSRVARTGYVSSAATIKPSSKRTRRAHYGRARRAVRMLGYGWLRFWFCRWLRHARWFASLRMTARSITDDPIATPNVGALRSARLCGHVPQLYERDVIRTAWRQYVAMLCIASC